jgi:hypothetical protein
VAMTTIFYLYSQFFLDFKILPCELVSMETYFVGVIKTPMLFTHIEGPEKINSLIDLNADPLNKVGWIDLELLFNQA